ncbi:MAG: hypothetical protein Q4C50_01230 [Eubacteriales bacterium]|nr:hypothetical protein [Eubacteriales bacterium]
MKDLKEKFYRFLEGRNGIDDLGIVLIVTSLVLLILSMPLKSSLLSMIAIGVLLYSYYRVFSKKLTARRAENQRFLAERERLRFKLQSLKLRMGSRKDYKYLKCKKCGQKMRVPRKKGKIEVTCPHCGEKFITKS